ELAQLGRRAVHEFLLQRREPIIDRRELDRVGGELEPEHFDANRQRLRVETRGDQRRVGAPLGRRLRGLARRRERRVAVRRGDGFLRRERLALAAQLRDRRVLAAQLLLEARQRAAPLILLEDDGRAPRLRRGD